MARINLNDGTGRWFDDEKLLGQWEEGQRWDGRNHISLATGLQWDHEQLYRTAQGRWLVQWWSQWQGTREQWRELDTAAAIVWLQQNGHAEDAARIDAAIVASLEL